MLASIVRGLFEVAVGAGVDRAALLRRLEVDEATLADTNASVPLEAHMRVWEALGELALPEPLALGLVRHFRVDMFGVFGWVMMNVPLAGDIVKVSRRFQALVGDPFVPNIDDTADAMTIHRVFEPRIAKTRVAPEYAVAITVWLIREMTGIAPGEELVREVWFQHPPLDDAPLHDAFYGVNVRWSAPETRLVLARSAVDRPVLRRNPELFAYLEKHAEELQAKIAASSSVANRVRALVLETLKSGEPTPAAIAKRLSTSERTLQRRLKDEGRTFAEILDDVRRELAVRYLADPKLAIFEIAFLLGYSETSPFTRAFKRWTNEAPAEYRARISAA